MQPCQVCGGMAVDQNGYCTQCGTFRGQPTQPVSGAPYPPQPGGYQPYQAGPAPASGSPWPGQTSAAPYPYSGPPVSGTPGYPPPQQGRRPVMLILIGAIAVVVLLIGAIVVVALARSGKGGGTPVADNSKAGTSPSAAAAIDPCLVGTWQATSEHQQQDYPGVGPVTLIGQGVVTRVHADGTANDDYSKASPYTGSYNGHSITMTVTGTVQARITTANGTLTFHDPQANGTVSYKVDGQPVGSPIPLEVTGDPVQYSCQGKTATEHTTQYDVTMTKISDSP
jgi:hypothetical protein